MRRKRRNQSYTAGGQYIDWDALRKKNKNTVAIGNIRMNTNGDLLDEQGRVVKSREKMDQEYYESNQNAVRHVNIKNDAIRTEEEYVSPQDAINQLKQQKSQKRKQNSSKRKIEENDE